MPAMTEEQLPESWKPVKPTLATIDGLELPGCDTTDPAQLEALFGNFGFYEHFRKVVLSNCTELIRAEYVEKETKITESRLEDLARIHYAYIGFLTDGLNGRTLREQNVKDSLFNPTASRQ